MGNSIKIGMLTSIFAILSCSANAGTQKYNLDEMQRIEGHISGTESNRIKIEGDRIVEVIGLNESWALESDEKLGQIFIKAAKEGSPKAVFSVVTEKGKTQDFSLKAKPGQDGQIIIVQNKELELDAKIIGSKHARHDELINLIKTGRKLSSDGNPTIYTEGNLEFSSFNEKRVGKYVLEIWSIANKGEQSISLEEKSFVSRAPQTAAIMFEKLDLKKGESTKLYKVNHYE